LGSILKYNRLSNALNSTLNRNKAKKPNHGKESKGCYAVTPHAEH